MKELEHALLSLHNHWVGMYGESGVRPTITQQVEAFRTRAAAGKMALEAQARAEQCAAELTALIAAFDASVEVQIGHLVQRRKIKVGEVVGTWTKSKGNGAKRELSRAEFKHEVSALGLARRDGSPITPKELGAIFDGVDADRSGFLDLEEVRTSMLSVQARVRI